MVDENLPPVEVSSDPGVGGVVQQPSNDVALEQLALRRGWAIPEKYKQAIVDRQLRIAMDPKSSNRDSTRAFQAVAKCDRDQWERDNPKQTVNATQVNINGQPVDDGISIEVIEYEEIPPRGELPGDGEGDQS